MHPGNILVEKVVVPQAGLFSIFRRVITPDYVAYDPRLIILDCGLVVSLNDRCRQNLRDVFYSVLMGNVSPRDNVHFLLTCASCSSFLNGGPKLEEHVYFFSSLFFFPYRSMLSFGILMGNVNQRETRRLFLIKAHLFRYPSLEVKGIAVVKYMIKYLRYIKVIGYIYTNINFDL